jgi:hypothetical protein
VKEIIRLVIYFVVEDVEDDKLSALMVLVFLQIKGLFPIRYVLLLWKKIIQLVYLLDIQIGAGYILALAH